MQAAFFTSLETGAASCPNLQIGGLASDCRGRRAIAVVEIAVGACPCATVPTVTVDFDMQAKPIGELLELSGRQKIPSLFRDVIAVLADPAPGRVDRLRAPSDVPEQATKSADELTPDVLVDR